MKIPTVTAMKTPMMTTMSKLSEDLLLSVSSNQSIQTKRTKILQPLLTTMRTKKTKRLPKPQRLLQ